MKEVNLQIKGKLIGFQWLVPELRCIPDYDYEAKYVEFERAIDKWLKSLGKLPPSMVTASTYLGYLFRSTPDEDGDIHPRDLEENDLFIPGDWLVFSVCLHGGVFSIDCHQMANEVVSNMFDQGNVLT